MHADITPCADVCPIPRILVLVLSCCVLRIAWRERKKWRQLRGALDVNNAEILSYFALHATIQHIKYDPDLDEEKERDYLRPDQTDNGTNFTGVQVRRKVIRGVCCVERW